MCTAYCFDIVKPREEEPLRRLLRDVHRHGGIRALGLVFYASALGLLHSAARNSRVGKWIANRYRLDERPTR